MSPLPPLDQDAWTAAELQVAALQAVGLVVPPLPARTAPERVLEALRVEYWVRLDLMPPTRPGYYRVRDYECREGVAFRHRNGEWTLIGDGNPQKPYADWMDLT